MHMLESQTLVLVVVKENLYQLREKKLLVTDFFVFQS